MESSPGLQGTAPHFTTEAAPARLLIAALKRSVEHAATVHLERTARFFSGKPTPCLQILHFTSKTICFGAGHTQMDRALKTQQSIPR